MADVYTGLPEISKMECFKTTAKSRELLLPSVPPLMSARIFDTPFNSYYYNIIWTLHYTLLFMDLFLSCGNSGVCGLN